MRANRELILHLYEAYNARNIEEVLQLLHPNIDWANGMEGGVIHGRQALREHWKRMFPFIRLQVHPLNFISEEENRVELTIHLTGHDATEHLVVDNEFKHIFTFENGLITSFKIVDFEALLPRLKS